MSRVDRLLSPEVAQEATLFAVKSVVTNALQHLQPQPGGIPEYAVGTEYGITTYSAGAYDQKRNIFYRVENTNVIITPEHEETYGPVISSVGDTRVGLVIRPIQLDWRGFPKEALAPVNFPRDVEQVTPHALHLAGITPEHLSGLLELANSLGRAYTADVRTHILHTHRLRWADRSFHTPPEVA